MKFADRYLRSVATLALAASLSACAGGADDFGDTPVASTGKPQFGPAADYPITVGAPYEIDGVVYEPSESLNYDAVGYVAVDRSASGVTIAHQTLPYPSYVEIASLETGKTILARVEGRGPMTTARIAALSPDALAQLEATEGTPVRIRRVNPPEDQRMLLRQGLRAADRMETPMPLVEVLRRRLKDGPKPVLVSAQPTVMRPSSDAPVLSPLATPDAPASAPPRSARPVSAPAPAAARPAVRKEGRFRVQAAAFSTSARAQSAATALSGMVIPAGPYFRVQTGPFATQAEAQTSLAKVRAAGYSDARIIEVE